MVSLRRLRSTAGLPSGPAACGVGLTGAAFSLMAMSQQTVEEEQGPPQGEVRIVYLGPTAPHWEIHGVFGDSRLIDGFRDRVMARLMLLPPHDPQFRRNRERVARDAERERLILSWDLGMPDEQAPPDPAYRA